MKIIYLSFLVFFLAACNEDEPASASAPNTNNKPEAPAPKPSATPLSNSENKPEAPAAKPSTAPLSNSENKPEAPAAKPSAAPLSNPENKPAAPAPKPSAAPLSNSENKPAAPAAKPSAAPLSNPENKPAAPAPKPSATPVSNPKNKLEEEFFELIKKDWLSMNDKELQDSFENVIMNKKDVHDKNLEFNRTKNEYLPDLIKCLDIYINKINALNLKEKTDFTISINDKNKNFHSIKLINIYKGFNTELSSFINERMNQDVMKIFLMRMVKLDIEIYFNVLNFNLSKNKKINEPTYMTPLQILINSTKTTKDVEELLKDGDILNKLKTKEHSPFALAQTPEIVNLLADKLANVQTTCQIVQLNNEQQKLSFTDGLTLFCAMHQNASFEVIKALINKGADVNKRTASNALLLNIVIFKKSFDIYKYIYDKTNINNITNDEKKELFKVSLINEKNDWNIAFHWLSKHKLELDIAGSDYLVKLLKKYDTQKDNDEYKKLVYELIKLGAPLIDKNAKINFNVKTKDGKDTGIESNILLFAIFKKDEELLKAIISKAKEDNILQNLLEDKDNTFTKKPNDILDGITSDEYKAIKTTFQEATK